MKISKLGGEFALIDRIVRKKGGVVGVGDDTAVLEYDEDRYLLYTADMLCEGDHFNLDWSTPHQVGIKAMESNVSDIAAMGGSPRYALVSVALSDEINVEFMDMLYRGIYQVADEYGFEVVGGDTTHGRYMVLAVTMLGDVKKEYISLRSDAKEGDKVFVTGDLGKSKAGLEILRSKYNGHVKAHLEPKSRLKQAHTITRYCNAMIDVSDGLSSEINHICSKSDVGAVIYEEKIPLSKRTRESAEKLGSDPVEFALYGGEDFELLFTIEEEKIQDIHVDCKITEIGEILPKKEGVTLKRRNEKKALVGGYDHFKQSSI